MCNRVFGLVRTLQCSAAAVPHRLHQRADLGASNGRTPFPACTRSVRPRGRTSAQHTGNPRRSMRGRMSVTRQMPSVGINDRARASVSSWRPPAEAGCQPLERFVRRTRHCQAPPCTLLGRLHRNARSAGASARYSRRSVP